MKKVIILLVAFFMTIVTLGQEVTFVDHDYLQIKEIVQTPNLTADQIYVNIQSLLSETHPNTNCQFVIDYSDLKTGTIISKGKYYLGYKNVMYKHGYALLADYNLTIRIKEGRTQILIKVPTVSIHWTTADLTNTDTDNDTKEDEKIVVKHVYPQYDGYKPTTYPYYAKKLMKEFGPQIPTAVKDLYKTISDKITSSGQDDDF